MRIKIRKLSYLKQTLRICGVILLVPLVAWLLEFAYNNYIAVFRKNPETQYMILSSHGHEGYDYTKLNTLLRKMQRIEKTYNQGIDLEDPEFLERVQQALTGLEEENKSFVTYYYSIVDLYTQANMPIKLRRRLQYYRRIINRSIAFLQQIQQDSAGEQREKI